MPEISHSDSSLPPGFAVKEGSTGNRSVAGSQTSVAAFLIASKEGSVTSVSTRQEFEAAFAPASAERDSGKTKISTSAWSAICGWFENGGGQAYIVPTTAGGEAADSSARDEASNLAALKSVEAQIVIAPDLWSTPATAPARAAEIAAHCAQMGDRIAVLHLERDTDPVVDAVKALGIASDDLRFATVYHPWINVSDPADPTQTVQVPPTGHVAGMWARVDASRGVHKAPANESLRGVVSLAKEASEAEQGEWSDVGVNSLRTVQTAGVHVWGARTLAASDTSDGEHAYLNVRRTVNFIKESIRQSTEWVVFEPNDDALRTSVQGTVSSFLTDQWRRGALVGATPDQAFYVRCDGTNNPPEDIAAGRLTVEVGAAIVRPSEFITLHITQIINQG
ncbi:phage tail sheath family protein [Streptomyces virginiae]|uniref:phage tail sheath family protein n=1 Tax=Streptomyces virginiae TaxID=1961 RepID=UPI00363BA464